MRHRGWVRSILSAVLAVKLIWEVDECLVGSLGLGMS